MTALRDKIDVNIARILKTIYQCAPWGHTNNKKILFIVGCQRSGTTMMLRVLELDFGTKVYQEKGILSSLDCDEGLRLNPLEWLWNKFEKDRCDLIVLKPLVETQNIVKFLDFFPSSKSLFMYRDFRDVCFSNLQRFGMSNGIRNLRFIVNNCNDNWRSESVLEEIRTIVLQFFSETMNPFDAAALFWFVRNRLYFDLNLEMDRRVMLCRYEDLVIRPKVLLDSIGDFVGFEFNVKKLIKNVKSSPIGKGAEINISPSIRNLCESLMQRLDHVYESKTVMKFPS